MYFVKLANFLAYKLKMKGSEGNGFDCDRTK